MHALVVDGRPRLAEIGHVHEDASEVLREHADGLVEGDPRRRAGAIGVQEEHWLPRADVVVVDCHTPGLDGLARPCLRESVRCDERHVCLLAAGASCGSYPFLTLPGMIPSPQVAGQGPHQICAGGNTGTGGGSIMEFEEVLEQTIALLQRQGRVSYGALKRRFKL